MRTRYGPGVSIPTTDGAEIEALAGSNPKLRCLGAERALHDRSAAQRAIRRRIDQAPVPVGQLPAPAITSYGFRPAPRPTCVTRQVVGTVTITLVRRDRERYDLVDDRRDLATGTPGAVLGRLLARLQHRGGDQHQRPVRHLPLGLGLLDLAGLQRRHRPDRVLRVVLDGPTWSGAGTPIRSASCAHGTSCLRSWECATRHAPLDRHRRGHLPDGVASNRGFGLSKLSRDRLQGVHSRPCSNDR